MAHEFTRIGILGIHHPTRPLALRLVYNDCRIILLDPKKERLERLIDQIRKSLDDLIASQKISPQARETLMAKIHVSMDPNAFNQVDLVIDNEPDEEGLKMVFYQELDDILPAQTVLAINNPLLSIARVYRNSPRAAQTVGLHLISLSQDIEGAEIIPTSKTDADSVRALRHLLDKIKLPHLTSPDRAGFVFLRLLLSQINEAANLLAESGLTAAEIDHFYTQITGNETGPLKMADQIGLDSILEHMKKRFHDYGDVKYAPSPLIIDHVNAGRLGKKTQQGFYPYEPYAFVRRESA